jgi:hypothetical protein
MVMAVANGAIREAFITPLFDAPTGHILSTAILCVAIFVVAWFSISWIGPNTGREALSIGIQWVGLTIAFEFLAGHYVFGNTWESLLPITICFTAASGCWCFSQSFLHHSGHFAGRAWCNAGHYGAADRD